MLVPDYDAADSAPSSEQIASAYRDVIEEAPWVVEVTCTLDPTALMEPSNRKFVRTGTLASNLDIKTYDGGNLFVCTTDGTAVAWGKLWVEYDVEFFVPQLPAEGPGLGLSAKVVGGGSISDTAYLGTAPTVTGGLSVSASGATLTFNQAGQFIMTIRLAGTTFTDTFPTVTGTATVVNSTAIGNAAGDTYIGVFFVTADPGETVIMDYNPACATCSASIVRIAPYLVSLG
jgi:hypothetical protein